MSGYNGNRGGYGGYEGAHGGNRGGYGEGATMVMEGMKEDTMATEVVMEGMKTDTAGTMVAMAVTVDISFVTTQSRASRCIEGTNESHLLAGNFDVEHTTTRLDIGK